MTLRTRLSYASRKKIFAAAASALALILMFSAIPSRAQRPAKDPNGESLPDAIEAIDRARVATRVLFITAHPDDEASTLLTYLSRGAGDDVALLTLTRGEGGQNAIGSEQGPRLAIIRSAELNAAAQTYGAKLFFTRAPDFGFSKTMEETLNIWGDTATADMVRVIRTFRPDIVINGWGGVRGGHGNHQASGFLVPKAVELAADPKAYSDQFKEGIGSWKVGLLLQQGGRGGNGATVTLPVNDISPIWGESYGEIGRAGFANQRSQGVVAFTNSAFLRRPASIQRADGGALDMKMIAQPIKSLADRYPSWRKELQPGLNEIDAALVRARTAALALDWPRAVKELAAAGKNIARIDSAVSSRDIFGLVPDWDNIVYEIFRERARIDHALTIAAGVRMIAQSDRANLVAGETFTVRVEALHRDNIPNADFATPSLVLPSNWQAAAPTKDQNDAWAIQVTLPKDATAPHGAADWMFPFAPPLVEAREHSTIEGYSFDSDTVVQAQRFTTTTVITEQLRVTPAVGLTLEPNEFLLAENPKAPGAAHQPFEVLIRVHSYSSDAQQLNVGLDVPADWHASATQPTNLAPGADELLRFTVTPSAKLPAGDYELNAWAKRGADTFRTSIEPLPSLPTFLWSEPAVAPVRAFPIIVPEKLHVGYVAADIDLVPEAIQRLGIQVDLLDSAALTFGDLKRFDAIVIGIRAYELRGDVLANNQRLLDYANNGGTLILEYERDGFWGNLKTQITPYPAKMEGGTLRITDEKSDVKFLTPDSPLLNFPNKITQDDFKGWVQERANYLWSSYDPHYQAVLSMHDPGEADLTGSLVWTRYGKGVYIYAALEFFRQLPEGNPGAYRLFVNLLSQSRAK
ncbi:MAG TPA: PIG-L family deacetylase [Candidatus Acidoferrales bacterium]